MMRQPAPHQLEALLLRRHAVERHVGQQRRLRGARAVHRRHVGRTAQNRVYRKATWMRKEQERGTERVRKRESAEERE
jgi:hypothetical protein